MYIKTKIEKAGYVYKAMFGTLEVYVKDGIGLMYDPAKDTVLAYAKWGNPQLHIIDDIQLEILLG